MDISQGGGNRKYLKIVLKIGVPKLQKKTKLKKPITLDITHLNSNNDHKKFLSF